MNWKLLLPATVVFTAFSCKRADKKTYAIDSPITITLKQTVPATGKAQFSLYCTTGVLNNDYVLNYQLVNNGNDIAINFLNISEPAPAYPFTYTGSSFAQVDLTNLSNGSHSISFQVNSNTYQGTLTVSDTDYVIAFAQPPVNLLCTKPSIKRLQPNTIWGFIQWTGKDSTGSSANRIIDSLVFLGAQPYTGPVGDYIVFNNDSGYSYLPLTKSFRSKHFIYTYPGDFNKIAGLVRYFDDNVVDGVCQFETYTGAGHSQFYIPRVVSVSYAGK